MQRHKLDRDILWSCKESCYDDPFYTVICRTCGAVWHTWDTPDGRRCCPVNTEALTCPAGHPYPVEWELAERLSKLFRRNKQNEQ